MHLCHKNFSLQHRHKRMPDLPIEILREIFAYFSSTLHVREAHKFPWYLGQICSRWRALFFSMRSTFWGRIDIEWDHHYDNRRLIRFCKHLKMIVPFFLSRTQGGPFSFSLFRTLGYPDEKNVRWIVKDFVDHSRQWEDASFRLESADIRFLRSVKGHLPLLKRLELIVPSYYEDAVHRSLTGILGDTPLLSHLVVENVSAWEFDWSSLTILCVGRQENITKFLAILQKSINLVKLSVRDEFDSDTLGITSGSMIHFPHLEYLSILGVELLTVLETPALRCLEVLNYWSVDSDNWNEDSASFVVKADQTVDFLRRSRLRLTLWESKSGHKILLHTLTI